MTRARSLRRALRSGGVGGATVIALSVLVSACSTGDVRSVEPAPGGAPSSTGPTVTSTAPSPSDATSSAPAAPKPPSGVAPLTGLAVTPELARRPAVAVAVVRADGGSVVGVTAADLVYEEFDAPGRSRLLAIFQSKDATVGPVADTAPLDAPLLGAAKPVFAYAGGPGSFVRQLADRVVDASALRQPSFFSGTRPAQRVSTARLRTLAPATAAAPPPVFSHRPVGEPPVDTAANAERAVVKVSGAATRTWTWQEKTGTWRRDDGIEAANVLVFTVPYKDVPRGKDGGEVATATPIGEGKALALTGLSRGRSIAATWYRRSRTGTFNVLDDKAKKAVRLTPGSTWVVLAPSGSTVSTS